jgi:hypothetical protein
MVMNTNTKRESGRKAQLANIQAAKVAPFPLRQSPTSLPPLSARSPCSRCCSIPWEESS